MCHKRSNDMHARQSVAYKQIAKNRIMKNISSNTSIQWSLLTPKFLKINLVRLTLRIQNLKHLYQYNKKKPR